MGSQTNSIGLKSGLYKGQTFLAKPLSWWSLCLTVFDWWHIQLSSIKNWCSLKVSIPAVVSKLIKSALMHFLETSTILLNQCHLYIPKTRENRDIDFSMVLTGCYRVAGPYEPIDSGFYFNSLFCFAAAPRPLRSILSEIVESFLSTQFWS